MRTPAKIARVGHSFIFMLIITYWQIAAFRKARSTSSDVEWHTKALQKLLVGRPREIKYVCLILALPSVTKSKLEPKDKTKHPPSTTRKRMSGLTHS